MDRRYAIGGAAGAAGLLCALLLVIGIFSGIGTAEDPPPPPNPTPTAQCGDETGFYSRLATGNRFGPAVESTETNEIQKELHTRRCMDPALTVAHVEYQDRAYTSPEERARRTVELRDNPELRGQKVEELETREATAVKVEVVEMGNEYQTMYMTPSAPGQVPWIYATTVDRPTFKVIKFTYTDGSWDAYKLDCGLQPVATSFPGLPSAPEAPPAVPVTPGTPPPEEVCPPDKPYGRPPVCKDTPNEDPWPQGNLPPGGGGPEEGPSAEGGPIPPAGRPPDVYVPPTTPTGPPTTQPGPVVTSPPTTSPPGTVPTSLVPPTTEFQAPR